MRTTEEIWFQPMKNMHLRVILIAFSSDIYVLKDASRISISNSVKACSRCSCNKEQVGKSFVELRLTFLVMVH